MDIYRSEGFYDRLEILEEENGSLDRGDRLRAIKKPLLAWYGARARSLPWRENQEPYRVWISEIMLQQTRVEAVKPYFERFMKAFPSVKELAEAEDDYLMKMWEGLGYYNRARNLKAAAGIIMADHGGKLPSSYEELIRLPGIGSYTAGAIASIAFGIPLPAVDGNVLRVISRLMGDREDIKKAGVKSRMEEELKAVMPVDDASRYNQGLIEIGALVCIPGGEPRCGECPLASLCLTRKNGWWKEIPYKSPAKKRRIQDKTVFIIEYRDKVAIHKRPMGGLLAALYELPNVEGCLSRDQVADALGVDPKLLEEVTPLPCAKHVFSHVEWHMKGYRVVVNRRGKLPDPWLLVSREELSSTYALPNAFQAYASLIV